MSHLQKSKFISFFFMLIVYFATMGFYYYQTHEIIIKDTQKSIRDVLLSQKAFANIVSKIQKPEIEKLRELGIIDKNYYSTELLSSAYLTKRLNDFANTERKKLGLNTLEFKYASLNPTNTKNLANNYEKEIFHKFTTKNIKEFKQTLNENGKQYLYYAIAGKRMEKSCLQCHDTPSKAPKDLVKIYGNKNGFGYKVGDLSSIISIKVPLNNIYKENDEKFTLIAIFIFILFSSLFFIAESIKNNLKNKEKALSRAKKDNLKEVKKTMELENSLENLYEHVLSSQFDTHGNVTEVSDALSKVSEYSKEELIGKSFCTFKHPDTSEQLFVNIWEALKDGKSWMGEVKNISKSGNMFWCETTITPMKDDNNITYSYESIMRVITEKKALQKDINLDYLTQLLNRRSFEEHFTKERDRAKRDKKYIALMMLDIDYFKKYNDFYGHQQGDEALKIVAKTLKENFARSCDIVFRLGGEEFAIITSDSSVENIISSAYNECEKLKQAHIIHIQSDISPFLSVSIGVAIVSYNSEVSLSEMYELSDKKLYEAKENGRNTVRYIEL